MFCSLLKTELGAYLCFEIPKGGMAIWVVLNKRYSWELVTKIALEQKLVIPEWQRYDMANAKHNGIRIGFAAYNESEIYEFVKRFKKTMIEVEKVLEAK